MGDIPKYEENLTTNLQRSNLYGQGTMEDFAIMVQKGKYKYKLNCN